METCQWHQFTGITCKEWATKNLYDVKNDRYVDVCETHFNEFREDSKKRQG